MSDFHLAQMNSARIRFPMDSPEMAEFAAALDPMNALADGTPGFVWRYVAEGTNNATEVRPVEGDDEILINMSVWESREQLYDFVYKSPHLDYLRRRREWFMAVAALDQVLWWIPAGTLPTVEEGLRRLNLVRANGPSPEAFTFRKFYEPVSEDLLLKP